MVLGGSLHWIFHTRTAPAFRPDQAETGRVYRKFGKAKPVTESFPRRLVTKTIVHQLRKSDVQRRTATKTFIHGHIIIGMKWITRITLLICLTLPTLLSGCSTTRKTAKGTEQTNVTAIQETDRTEEEKRLAEVITNTETNDRTNVVIEFTKTEYADGSTETKTEPPEQHPGEKVKPKPGTESKGGIKSVTTGKITINGDRKETTATTATETGEKKAETQTTTGVSADKTATVETEQEKKPKRGLLDWIFLAGIVAACAAGITYAVRRFKIKAGK